VLHIITFNKMSDHKNNNDNNNNNNTNNHGTKRTSQFSLESSIRKVLKDRCKLDTKNGNPWSEEMYEHQLQLEWESRRPQKKNNPTHNTNAHNINNNHSNSHSNNNNNNNNSHNHDSKSEYVPMEDIQQNTHPPAWTQAAQVYINT
jgi:hypothetical protein